MSCKHCGGTGKVYEDGGIFNYEIEITCSCREWSREGYKIKRNDNAYLFYLDSDRTTLQDAEDLVNLLNRGNNG